MKHSDFAPEAPGELVQVTSRTGKPGLAFIPSPLPPDLVYDREIVHAAERAALAVGNLNGSGQMLPNPTLLIRPFMSREAIASSRIEGTHVEFEELVLLEVSPLGVETDPDYKEVANYIDALSTGWNKPAERPVSPGFLMELHRQLLAGGRGAHQHPGELRDIQVMIGSHGDDLQSARFVPPPPDRVRPMLQDLCTYIESADDVPSLIRIALIHYQFETIHPFRDGNGRLGRLLMPLVLGIWGDLDLPLLYLSEYFEEHRDEYIGQLLRVSQTGSWTDWILFTLRAMEHQANSAVRKGRLLLGLREELRQRYQVGRTANTLRIIDRLFERPALTISQVAESTGITISAAGRIVDTLVNDGVLREATGQKRNRVYLADDIISIIVSRSLDE
jgi:Fic family protein